MPELPLDPFLDALGAAHSSPDPMLAAELAARFDTLLEDCRSLPRGLAPLVEQALWDLLPADWALWQELARADARH
jgi:hypothetical protein